jgi:hypothetical protein
LAEKHQRSRHRQTPAVEPQPAQAECSLQQYEQAIQELLVQLRGHQLEAARSAVLTGFASRWLDHLTPQNRRMFMWRLEQRVKKLVDTGRLDG